jgi:hypothetical protein
VQWAIGNLDRAERRSRRQRERVGRGWRDALQLAQREAQYLALADRRQKTRLHSLWVKQNPSRHTDLLIVVAGSGDRR